MGTRAFAALVGRALFLDRADPVAAWGALRERQARLIETLSAAREIRIEAPGTDLTLARRGADVAELRRQAQPALGRGLHRPARGVGRTARSASPSRARRAASTSPACELTFRDGVVVEARAERGEAYLQRDPRAPTPGARRLGELGIGTNTGLDRPTGLILLDEKIGGTVHLALGRSYPETGGVNESAVHWDLICDLRTGGRLLADGEPLVSTGPNL